MGMKEPGISLCQYLQKQQINDEKIEAHLRKVEKKSFLLREYPWQKISMSSLMYDGDIDIIVEYDRAPEALEILDSLRNFRHITGKSKGKNGGHAT